VRLSSVAFVGLLLLTAACDIRNLLLSRPLELTMSVAVLLVFVAGYLVGIGHVFTPVASAIVITMLLASFGIAVAALLLAIVAMFARNLVIPALFSPAAVTTAAGPLIVMAIGALILVRRSPTRAGDAPAEIHLESPVSMTRVLNFAGLFLLIQVASTIGERYLGKFGFGVQRQYNCAAANMVAYGQLQPARLTSKKSRNSPSTRG
jgi:uncharacterized membrane protein (DUF4010 family)